jgi:hypothetical protein
VTTIVLVIFIGITLRVEIFAQVGVLLHQEVILANAYPEEFGF